MNGLRRGLRDIAKQRYGYYFVLPALVLFALFVLWPFIQAVILGFYKYDIGVRKFIGLQNYIKMFHDPVFLKTLMNNGLYIALRGTLLSLSFAGHIDGDP